MTVQARQILEIGLGVEAGAARLEGVDLEPGLLEECAGGGFIRGVEAATEPIPIGGGGFIVPDGRMSGCVVPHIRNI